MSDTPPTRGAPLTAYEQMREPRCPGSGRTALKSLCDQNRQQCRVCNQYIWITRCGYLEAHTPTRVKP